MTELEHRTVDVDIDRVRTEGSKLVGHAAVFDVTSEDLGGFNERIAAGAFRDVLNTDVRLLVDHKPPPLARTKAGTLRLHEDATGLAFEADLADTQHARDLRTSLTRGDLDGMSFSFTVGDEDWDGDVRTVTRVASLRDICIATYPAYPDTSVQLRTRDTTKEQPVPDTEPDPTTTTASTGTTFTSNPTTANTAGLAVETRTATDATATIEERVVTALRSVRKGETRSLTTSSASAIAPPELSTFLFEKLRASSTVLASGVRVIATDRESIEWPKLSVDVSPDWYSETDAITPGDPTFVTLTATPRKLAHLVQASNEVIDDSDPSVVSVLNTHLATVLGLRLDYYLLEGTGTAPQIRGLKNVAGIQSVSMGTNGASLTNLDPVADAIGLLEAANAPKPYAIIAPPRTWAVIRKLKDTTNRPLLEPSPTSDAQPSLFGARVATTSQLTTTETQGTSSDASSIYVFSPAEVVFVRRQDAEVELDRSRLFNSDQSELRAKLRCDMIVPNPEAVVRIKGVRP